MYVAGFTLNPKLGETVTLSFSQQYSFPSGGYLLANPPSPAALPLLQKWCIPYPHRSHLLMNMHHVLHSCTRKLGPQFSKLHSWLECYITIRIRQLPSQQALQKSYESQRMQPCQPSHCHMLSHLKRRCVFLFLVIYLKHQHQLYWPVGLVLKSLLL